jgi:hypothetical protein
MKLELMKGETLPIDFPTESVVLSILEYKKKNEFTHLVINFRTIVRNFLQALTPGEVKNKNKIRLNILKSGEYKVSLYNMFVKNLDVFESILNDNRQEKEMRFLTTFKKTKECSFESWLKLVDDLKPHMQKNGLKLIVATETEDGTRIYDIAEAETMEGVEAFMSDPEVIRMRQEAGVDTDSQEVINAVSEYHIFQN